MTVLFFVLVGGLAVFGLVNQGAGGCLVGIVAGGVLWLICGIFWLVDTAVDCSEDRDDGSYYTVEEKCQ